MSFLGWANRVSWELDEKVWLGPADRGKHRAPKAIKSARLRAAASHCMKSKEFLSVSNTDVCNSGIPASKPGRNQATSHSIYQKQRSTIEDPFRP